MINNSRELLQKLNNYVGHAHHVYSTTHREYRTNINYGKILEQIAWCRCQIKGINRFSGDRSISRLIIAMRKQLREILPVPINSSYQQSLQEFNEIIAYCERVLTDKKLTLDK